MKDLHKGKFGYSMDEEVIEFRGYGFHSRVREYDIQFSVTRGTLPSVAALEFPAMLTARFASDILARLARHLTARGPVCAPLGKGESVHSVMKRSSRQMLPNSLPWEGHCHRSLHLDKA